jgi:hypothetical protein
MLHRIANQWGYNLASRSMDLQAVAFPALVAADDGWVQYLSEAEELSVYAKLVRRKVTVSLSLRPVSEAPFQFVCDVIEEESMYSWLS